MSALRPDSQGMGESKGPSDINSGRDTELSVTRHGRTYTRY